jgi:3'-5' exoribonuclease
VPTTDSAKPRLLNELQSGDRLEGQIVRLASKDMRTAANGSLYLNAVLADRSGQLQARMWNISSELFGSLAEGGLINVRGRVDTYKSNRQIIIDGVQTVAPGEVDPADFLPTTKHDVDAMWNKLKDVLRTVKNPHLLALLGKFLNDSSFVTAFKRSPAAVSMHHSVIGGLLEHTLGLLNTAQAVLPLYPKVSRDLVLTGVFLHDAGKTKEMTYATNFEYTREGQLLGHITQCILDVHDKVREIERESGKEFPRELETAIEHIILSHHGRLEFGSPKLPATPEAIMIHYLDNLDAKMNMVFEAIEGDADQSQEFTPFLRALETRLYKTDVTGSRPK